MIKSNSFVPGRVYSIAYSSAVEMVGKREFTAHDIRDCSALRAIFTAENPTAEKPFMCKLQNPIADLDVTVRRVSTVQAAGEVTWANFKAKNGIETESSREPWYRVSDENSCIVIHKKTDATYLRGLPRGVTKEEYFIGGIPATDEQVKLIRSFKKSNGREALFVTLRLDNLENVLDETGERE